MKIEDLYQHYLTLTSDPRQRQPWCSAHVTEGKPVAEGAMSVGDAGRMLGVSGRTVNRLCQAGKLKFIRVGRAIRVNRVDLDEYMADVEKPQPPPMRCLK